MLLCLNNSDICTQYDICMFFYDRFKLKQCLLLCALSMTYIVVHTQYTYIYIFCHVGKRYIHAQHTLYTRDYILYVYGVYNIYMHNVQGGS